MNSEINIDHTTNIVTRPTCQSCETTLFELPQIPHQ